MQTNVQIIYPLTNFESVSIFLDYSKKFSEIRFFVDEFLDFFLFFPVQFPNSQIPGHGQPVFTHFGSRVRRERRSYRAFHKEIRIYHNNYSKRKAASFYDTCTIIKAVPEPLRWNACSWDTKHDIFITFIMGTPRIAVRTILSNFMLIEQHNTFQ